MACPCQVLDARPFLRGGAARSEQPCTATSSGATAALPGHINSSLNSHLRRRRGGSKRQVSAASIVGNSFRCGGESASEPNSVIGISRNERRSFKQRHSPMRLH